MSSPLLADIDVTGSMARRMRRVAVVAVCLASLIVLGTAVQNYMEFNMHRGDDVAFWRLLIWPSICWYSWALMTPFFFELAWRQPLTRAAWARPLGVLLIGNAVAFALHVGLQMLAMLLPMYRHNHPDLADALAYHSITSFYLNVFIYWCIVGGAHALRLYTQAQRRALLAARLETELAQARLSALKMQLHPHFLFNTLHGISTLMYRDVAMADRMVMRLSQLLRHSLDRSDAHEVTLREELDFLEEYLAIEQLRFGDGLRVRFDVDDALDDALLPSFGLQPLVENALKHGIAPHGHAGTIAVTARAEGDRLHLTVADDGQGMQGDGMASGGVGLANLQARLQRLYGEQHTLSLLDVSPHGLRVEMSLPLRFSSPDTGTRPGTASVIPSGLG